MSETNEETPNPSETEQPAKRKTNKALLYVAGGIALIGGLVFSYFNGIITLPTIEETKPIAYNGKEYKTVDDAMNAYKGVIAVVDGKNVSSYAELSDLVDANENTAYYCYTSTVYHVLYDNHGKLDGLSLNMIMNWFDPYIIGEPIAWKDERTAEKILPILYWSNIKNVPEEYNKKNPAETYYSKWENGRLTAESVIGSECKEVVKNTDALTFSKKLQLAEKEGKATPYFQKIHTLSVSSPLNEFFNKGFIDASLTYYGTESIDTNINININLYNESGKVDKIKIIGNIFANNEQEVAKTFYISQIDEAIEYMSKSFNFNCLDTSFDSIYPDAAASCSSESVWNQEQKQAYLEGYKAYFAWVNAPANAPFPQYNK